MTDPTGVTWWSAQVGHVWLRLRDMYVGGEYLLPRLRDMYVGGEYLSRVQYYLHHMSDTRMK
jgi:hypothetical protein